MTTPDFISLNLTLIVKPVANQTIGDGHPPLGDGSTPPWMTQVLVAYFIKLYYTPIVIVSGLISNIISFSILTHNAFTHLSSSQYLRAIHCVNMLFLLMLLGTWLTRMGYNIYDRPFWCQLTFLCVDISAFLIIWFTVAFCVDRYICICWPPEAPRMCTPLRARVVIISLTLLALSIFLNTSLTVGVVYTNGFPFCTHLNLPFRTSQGLVTLDCVVNHILPLTMILCLTALMCLRLRREQRNLYADTSDPSKVKPLTLTYLIGFMVLNLPQELWFLVSMLQPRAAPTASPTLYLMRTVFQSLSHTMAAASLYILLASYPMFRQYLKVDLLKVVRFCRQITCRKKQVLSGNTIAESVRLNRETECITEYL